MVLPLSPVTCLIWAPGISLWSVFTWGICADDVYSITVLLAVPVALPVPATLNPRAGSWLAVVAARPATPVPLSTWSCTWPGLTVGTGWGLAGAGRFAGVRVGVVLGIGS